MIDLHSHLLPGVDDGSVSLEVSLEMARMAEDDGIEVMACTPHFMPGLYDNESQDILQRVERLNHDLADAGHHLAVVSGADAHIRPDFVSALQTGRILTLHGSRYVLFEPPHTTTPKRMNDLLHEVIVAGYVPILTHPERLKWIEQQYDLILEAASQGVWMQITAGSLTGRFGKRPQYWAQRMLGEGLVSILATDAHDTRSRPPKLSTARELAAKELGQEEADNLVIHRPVCVLENAAPGDVPALPAPLRQATGLGAALKRMLGMQT